MLAAKPFLQFLGVDSHREVLVEALETSETSAAPFCVGAQIGLAVLVQVIGVCGKDGVHVECVVLPPLQSYVNT